MDINKLGYAITSMFKILGLMLTERDASLHAGCMQGGWEGVHEWGLV